MSPEQWQRKGHRDNQYSLVLLQWVRLISLPPDWRTTSGPHNQRGMERRRLDEHWYMGHIQCLHFKGITVSITDPAGTVIVFSTHVMISLQSLSSSSHILLSFVLQPCFPALSFPGEGFIVSLGISTAMCALSGFTLIAFGRGVLLNTSRQDD